MQQWGLPVSSRGSAQKLSNSSLQFHWLIRLSTACSTSSRGSKALVNLAKLPSAPWPVAAACTAKPAQAIMASLQVKHTL